MKTKTLTTHVPLELADKLDQIALIKERSRGWIIKQALIEWIALENERYELTLEALADVDKGNTIDHQSIQAWVGSLGTENTLPVPK